MKSEKIQEVHVNMNNGWDSMGNFIALLQQEI